MDITRRQLLIVGGATVPALYFLGGTAPASAAAPGSISSSAQLRDVHFFSTDFTQAYRIAYPGVVSVVNTKAGAARALTIGVESDPRLVSSDAPTVASKDSALTGVSVAENSAETIAAEEYHAVLTNDLRAESDLSIALPFVTRILYPNDGVDIATGIALDVNAALAGGFSEDWKPEIVAADGLAWGASVTASWSIVPGTDESDGYAYPTIVTCRSVGPGYIPAGATIRVRVDGGALSSIATDRTRMAFGTVFSDFYIETLSDSAQERQVSVTLINPVPAGEKVELRFVGNPAEKLPATTRDATAAFEAPRADDVWQRLTGNELARRPIVMTEPARATRGSK